VLHREGTILHWNHGIGQTPDTLSVPWLLMAPGVAPRRWSGVTRSIDVFPTLAGLAGVRLPEGSVDGVDLSPALRGERPPPVLQAFSHTSILPPVLLRASLARGGTRLDVLGRSGAEGIWVTLREGDRVYKIAYLGVDRGFERRVFDLDTDPTEARNLYDPKDADQARAFAALERKRRDLVKTYHQVASPEPDLPSHDLLRRLGYVE